MNILQGLLLDLTDAVHPSAKKPISHAEAGYEHWRREWLEAEQARATAHAAYVEKHDAPRVAQMAAEAAHLQELAERRKALVTVKEEGRRQALREWVGFAASCDPLFVEKDAIFTAKTL